MKVKGPKTSFTIDFSATSITQDDFEKASEKDQNYYMSEFILPGLNLEKTINAFEKQKNKIVSSPEESIKDKKTQKKADADEIIPKVSCLCKRSKGLPILEN